MDRVCGERSLAKSITLRPWSVSLASPWVRRGKGNAAEELGTSVGQGGGTRGTLSPLTAPPSNALQTLERQLHRRLPRPLPVELFKAVRASLHRLHVHHHIHGCLEHRQRKAVHNTYGCVGYTSSRDVRLVGCMLSRVTQTASYTQRMMVGLHGSRYARTRRISKQVRTDAAGSHHDRQPRHQ